MISFCIRSVWESTERGKAMDNLDDTIKVRVGEQLDWPKVEYYLRTQLPTIGEGAIQVHQFPSGASNLTYLIQIGTWEGVLRRPPLGSIAPDVYEAE